MSCVTDLLIFSFRRRENGGVARSTSQSAMGEGMATVTRDDHDRAARMVLDLENLTPETLEEFFPSEHAVAV
jgi:hypothetical protein